VRLMAARKHKARQPRYRFRRPIHGGAGHRRMPDGCIWSGAVWFTGGIPTFVWYLYRNWPDCKGFDCAPHLAWIALKGAVWAALWPIYWVVQAF
jgi:hypothetical protein